MSAGQRAIVFDWAGTMVDFGCRAPVIALQRVLAARGVEVSEHEIRADMGRGKRDHIVALLAQAPVFRQWRERYGHVPQAHQIDDLLAELTTHLAPLNVELAQLVPGAAQTVAVLRAQGWKIGSCTGYTREMMAGVLPVAAAQGYAPDCVVCAGETPQGRPSPLMFWQNLIELQAWPASACVKVDDAPVGIEEGRAAGAWTVGVAASGNQIGLSVAQWAALPEEAREQRLALAREALYVAGADVVIDSIAELPAALLRLGVV